jgi:hypothetical protein
MPVLAMGAERATGARFVTQLTDHSRQLSGTRRSPTNAGRVRGLSANPAAAGQLACVRLRVMRSS